MNIAIFIVVLIFIAFDVLTGWLKALATGTTNSSIMRKGLFHKLGEVIAVIFGYVCQYALPYIGITIKVPFAVAIGTYIVLMEMASIVENISHVSPHLAQALSNVFSKESLNTGKEGDSNDEAEP